MFFRQCNVHLFQGLCTLGSRLQTAVRHGSGYVGSVLHCNAKVVWREDIRKHIVWYCHVNYTYISYGKPPGTTVFRAPREGNGFIGHLAQLLEIHWKVII